MALIRSNLSEKVKLTISVVLGMLFIAVTLFYPAAIIALMMGGLAIAGGVFLLMLLASIIHEVLWD